jgi:hypothetical protein
MQFIVKTAPKFIFLIVGLFIVFLSFISANTIFSQGDSLHLTEKKMYLKKEVLPDHVLYPVFMAFDRGKLYLASDEEKAELNISYGWQRLAATEELLKKGYQSLSFSTLTKACKYQNSGLIEAVNLSEEQQEKIIFQAVEFEKEVLQLEQSFSDEQRMEIDKLIHEQKFLLSNLY